MHKIVEIANKSDWFRVFDEENRAYQNEEIIKRYLKYWPSNLPVPAKIIHGFSLNEQPFNHLWDTKLPIFVYDKVWYSKLKSKKKCFLIPHPFYLRFLQRNREINKQVEGQGILFFYGHSTLWTKKVTDKQTLLNKLNEFPIQHMKIVFCFYWVDVINGEHLFFEERGYEVITIGNWHNSKFTDILQDEISKHKLIMSNDWGSYAYYSVLMGKPFSLVNVKPTIVETEDKNVSIEDVAFKPNSEMKLFYKLFSGLQFFITTEQREYVNERLCIAEYNKNKLFIYLELVMAYFKLRIKK